MAIRTKASAVNRKRRQPPTALTPNQRRLLAKQLHEGLLQTLSAASILARVVVTRCKNLSAPVLEVMSLKETIDAAIDETRALLRQLQTPEHLTTGPSRPKPVRLLPPSRKPRARKRKHVAHR